jgi:hypothetical protein
VPILAKTEGVGIFAHGRSAKGNVIHVLALEVQRPYRCHRAA